MNEVHEGDKPVKKGFHPLIGGSKPRSPSWTREAHIESNEDALGSKSTSPKSASKQLQDALGSQSPELGSQSPSKSGNHVSPRPRKRRKLTPSPIRPTGQLPLNFARANLDEFPNTEQHANSIRSHSRLVFFLLSGLFTWSSFLVNHLGRTRL